MPDRARRAASRGPDRSRSGSDGAPTGTPGWTIRPMEPEELLQTVDVWVRSRWDALRWIEERVNHGPEEDLAYFRDVLARHCEVWVAVAEEDPGAAREGSGARSARVLGLLALRPGHVEQLFVAPEHQGRGVGGALLRHAQALHPDGLSLFTHRRNERARRFYERRGFVAIAFGTSPPPESEPDVQYAWAGRREGRGG